MLIRCSFVSIIVLFCTYHVGSYRVATEECVAGTSVLIGLIGLVSSGGGAYPHFGDLLFGLISWHLCDLGGRLVVFYVLF